MQLKKILPLVFCFLSYLAHSQDNHMYLDRYLALRGKAFAFVIIEDIYFQNLTGGVEFRFSKRHSVGLDWVHFRWRYENDYYLDGYDQGYGPDAFRRRRYLLVDYRFYPFLSSSNFLPQKMDFYINPLVKLGRRKIWSETGSSTTDEFSDVVYTDRSDFTDYGLALGTKIYFSSKRKLGLDVSMGAIYRVGYIFEQTGYLNDQKSGFIVQNSPYRIWQFHMRLNLTYSFYSFQKKVTKPILD